MLRTLFIGSLCIFLLSCDRSDALQNIHERGKLIVLTTNQPTTYYFDRDEKPQGLEHDMAASFAKYLGVAAEYQVLDSKAKVIDALNAGKGDIAAAGLTVTEARAMQFGFGPVYMQVSEYLACHRDSPQLSSAEDMTELSIVVSPATSYIDTIQRQYPNIQLTIDHKASTPLLLKRVRDRDIQCTISDSSIFDINRRYYPEIAIRFTLHQGADIAWMLSEKNGNLSKALKQWFDAYQASEAQAQTFEKYFGHIDAFDYVDVQTFKRRINSRLPKYKHMFIAAAKQHSISPVVLAAQSYQESHWNPKAKSPTGVRGIMMLTQPVARSLGVTNRLDAKQNIVAGARYYNKMRKMFDEKVLEPDRTWLALAAYNIGRGHFRDAQGLAEKLGKNPNLWLDMKSVLPLLSEERYYKKLRYGYARGQEPVQYVNRIREYHAILEQSF